jgi:hypothetical protein
MSALWLGGGNDLTDGYLDLAADRIRTAPWLFEEANAIKLANDEPHVIDNPRSCSQCECWGQGPIGEDGLCPDCKTEVVVNAK